MAAAQGRSRLSPSSQPQTRVSSPGESLCACSSSTLHTARLWRIRDGTRCGGEVAHHTMLKMLERRPMPVDDVFFDCDSTLSTIEGIDELARLKGVEARIVELTNAAMDGQIPLQEVYAERLRLLAPTRADMRAIEDAYKKTVVPDARETIAALHELGRRVFIVRGGLADA